ncbi:MAG TPA: transketolase, partial [Clostridiales bacterium]|nr:transketolase [Clostridiales bacterium]
MTIQELEKKARQIRRDTLEEIHIAKSGHTGGSLSAIDLMVGIYYGKMRVDPQNPQWEDRDRFVLSKAHAIPALYPILADLGFFPREELKTLRKLHSNLQGHPDRKKTPGLDTSSGSLGQGLSLAVGMAIGARLRHKDIQVYAIMGDGESQEGQIWEASMAAAHYKLDNLTAIWDHNHLQIDGNNNDVMSLGDIEAKLRAFGYHVIVIDGNDMKQVMAALNEDPCGKPKAILAETRKGKGVSFMENQIGWH